MEELSKAKQDNELLKKANMKEAKQNQVLVAKTVQQKSGISN